MELTSIMLRTAFMYVFVFLMIRLMGKREIGKLSVFDMVISIMIAEIAVISIESVERSLWVTVAPIALLVVIQLGISLATLKNRRMRFWFDGKPSVLIRDGSINREEMKRQRYNLDDLLTQLRENRSVSVADVELAVLESDGKLSVIHRKKDEAATSDMNPGSEPPPKVRYELLPVVLIMDGEVQDDNLEVLGKTRFWLKKELRQRGIGSFKSVYFCSIDRQGKLFVNRK